MKITDIKPPVKKSVPASSNCASLKKVLIKLPALSILFLGLVLGPWYAVSAAPTQDPPNGNPSLSGTNYWSISGSNIYPTSTSYSVGIGTTTPAGKLQVNGGDRNTGIRVETSASAGLALKSTITNGHEYQLFSAYSGGGGVGSLNIYDQTAGAYRFVIDTSGNVGIGTTTPSGAWTRNLNINDAGSGGNAGVTFSQPTKSYSIGVVNTDLRIYDNTAGAYRFVVNTSGNIGIGTSTPATKLHLYDGSSGLILTISGLSTNYRGITIKDTGGAEQWFYGPNSSNDFIIRRSGSTDYITVASSTGNVGIGTSTPAYKLDVNGDINIAAGSVYKIGGVTQSGSSKWTAGTGDNIYRDLGNVGIGTTAPMALLDVSGTGRIRALSGTATGPSTGKGVEIGYASSTDLGLVVSYDRDHSVWEDLSIQGSNIRFYNGGTEKVRIASSGYVGIGTTAPSSTLHVVGSIQQTAVTSSLLAADSTGKIIAAGTSGYIPFHWSVVGETGVQYDPCIVHFPAASTIKSIFVGNKTSGDSVTFNLGYSTSPSTATSSLSKLFTSMQTVTNTTSITSLTIDGSYTPPANSCLTYFTTAASSTEFFINGFYTTP